MITLENFKERKAIKFILDLALECDVCNMSRTKSLLKPDDELWFKKTLDDKEWAELIRRIDDTSIEHHPIQLLYLSDLTKSITLRRSEKQVFKNDSELTQAHSPRLSEGWIEMVSREGNVYRGTKLEYHSELRAFVLTQPLNLESLYKSDESDECLA